MKTFKKILLLFAALILFAFVAPLQAQSAFTSTFNPKVLLLQGDQSILGGKTFQFAGKIDTTKSAGTEITYLTSQPFNAFAFQDTTIKPFLDGYLTTLDKDTTTCISIAIEGATTKEGTYTTIQTITRADSVALGTAKTKHIRKFIDYGGYHYPWLKIVITKATHNIKTNFDFVIVFLKTNKF